MVYHSVNVASFNQDLFLLCWSHTVAALSYVFENAEEKTIVQKSINGFRYSNYIITYIQTQRMYGMQCRTAFCRIPSKHE